MTIFEKLQSVTETAQNEQDLPNYLAERIFRLIENQNRFNVRNSEMEDLVDKVTNYDTYGQTGYLGMGVNSVILEKALNRLETICD
ncbi:MAG: GSU3529 family protein [Desulfuromonadaceae bacterium]